MLRRLAIRDFVLVDRLELEFSAGFGALTGETGAGKSILLDALSLLLGARAESALVREGCERAEVSASFQPALDSKLWDWLATNDFAHEDELILRRIVEANGRSRAYINGSPATGAQLKELGEHLADIHGQHAHHALLRGEAQRDLLDAQAGATMLAREVAEKYRAWQGARRERETAEAAGESAMREREMLEWQLGEARTLAFAPDAWRTTNADHQRLSHAVSLIDGAGAALAALADDEPALAEETDRLAHKLAELARFDAGLVPAAELLANAGIQLGEAASELRRYRDRVEVDPEALAEAERRITAVTQFARKYRVAVEEIPALLADWSERLAAIERAADVAGLAQSETAAQTAYLDVAKALSGLRKRAAAELGREVSAAMQELALSGGRFEIKLEAIESGGSHGLEAVEFLVAANPQQPLRALAKVASGGELSRIGLAIQVIASRAATTPTLIFDEVDVGIGGGVAEIVGRHLKALGAERQVLVVTHLPQVAARADWQWRVSKTAVGDGVRSTVTLLDSKGRVGEIARMLGGVDITETTRAHAAELLGGA